MPTCTHSQLIITSKLLVKKKKKAFNIQNMTNSVIYLKSARFTNFVTTFFTNC